MTIQILSSQIATLAPKALASYLAAFGVAQAAFDKHGISANALRVAHFMAQVLHESGALGLEYENLSYSAERLPVVWPSRFKPKGPLDPAQYARNPEALANEVYGGRMNNTAAGDGFRYRGRGLLQLTGKDSYAQATTMVRQFTPDSADFVADPDQVVSTLWCVEVAAAIWDAKACNALADQDNIEAITKKINGGTVGLPERQQWLVRTKAVWP